MESTMRATSTSGRAACTSTPSLSSMRGLHFRPLQRTKQVMRAAASDTDVVYQGRYGPWKVEPHDKLEVWSYRASITGAAVATLTAASVAFLPDGNVRSTLIFVLDPVCLFGAASLGVGLQLIHIYVDPIKRAIQILWLMGLMGSLYLMATQDLPAAMVVLNAPVLTFLVGPLFAALTGVAFKEGMCYGKPEAAGLFMITPLLFMGHLTSMVFMFLALPPEQQQALLARGEQGQEDEE